MGRRPPIRLSSVNELGVSPALAYQSMDVAAMMRAQSPVLSVDGRAKSGDINILTGSTTGYERISEEPGQTDEIALVNRTPSAPQS